MNICILGWSLPLPHQRVQACVKHSLKKDAGAIGLKSPHILVYFVFFHNSAPLHSTLLLVCISVSSPMVHYGASDWGHVQSFQTRCSGTEICLSSSLPLDLTDRSGLLLRKPILLQSSDNSCSAALWGWTLCSLWAPATPPHIF